MNIKTNTIVKLRCKFKNGLNKHGKEAFKNVSFLRVSNTITPEQAYQVATYVGKILDKTPVSATKITEDEHTQEI